MLRLATVDDAKAIYEIEKTMFDDNIYHKLSLKNIEVLLKKKSVYLYVYCNEINTPIGYSLGVVINKKSIWFNSLAVLKEFQTTNAAKLLFDQIESTCYHFNLNSVILEIRKDNKALLRRYKNLGYVIWKEIERYYPDQCGAYRMIKCLK
ncbi:MAG: GNAT family N-acetyltransferase [Campylobacterales bacterium]|nr:GNAT family N-acetyltransferase [Campylobacterales bacterium]